MTISKEGALIIHRACVGVMLAIIGIHVSHTFIEVLMCVSGGVATAAAGLLTE